MLRRTRIDYRTGSGSDRVLQPKVLQLNEHPVATAPGSVIVLPPQLIFQTFCAKPIQYRNAVASGPSANSTCVWHGDPTLPRDGTDFFDLIRSISDADRSIVAGSLPSRDKLKFVGHSTPITFSITSRNF